MTCGWDDETRQRRKAELEQATAAQGVSRLHILGYPDDPARPAGRRLDVTRLTSALRRFAANGYDAVFSHSPYGEVNNHPHHQDVSYSAHQAFDRVYSIAWNQYPALVHELTPAEYELKQHVMGTIYWREYRALASTYEIGSHERFALLTRESVDLCYWGIANFGDHHEQLGQRYTDMWGFSSSPYERERHAAITRLAGTVRPSRILEVGAAEGHLSLSLSRVAPIDCVETAPSYAERLAAHKFNVVTDPDTSAYDLVVLASVLEYMPRPEEYLSMLESPYVITDTHPFFPLPRVKNALAPRYEIIERCFVAPRWEPHYHSNTVESLRVYKIGSDTVLWRRR